MSLDIVSPRMLRIGGGAIGEMGEILDRFDIHKPLIVSDAFMVKHGFVDRLATCLDAAKIGFGTFTDTVPDPTTTSIEAGVRAFSKGQYDALVALGGGSPIDSAKAIGVLATLGGRMRDYKAPVQTDGPSVPVIAIPTTAGTGSEVTRFTIITDTATNEKMLCSGAAFMPTAAIIDYELTLSMPPRLTADTGIDALTHAMEAYVSRKANLFSDALALTAMRTIAKTLRTVYAEPTNIAAREAMMLAATQAGIAFSAASVALVHGMSRPIGAHFHLAHGLSNAMLLPKVTAFSVPGAMARYAECSRAMELATGSDDDTLAVEELLGELHRLNVELAVPTPQSLGVDRDAYFASIPTMAQQALASGSPANNPRVPSADEIAILYEQAWS